MKTENTIIFSKGAQFHGYKSILLFFVSIGLIARVIFLIYLDDYASIWPYLLLLPFSLFFMVDIEGVEIDIVNSRFREYKLRFWSRVGEWKDLKPFNTLVLRPATYNIHTSDLNTGGSESYTEQHMHIIVELYNPQSTKELRLIETSDYKKAHQVAKKASESLNLEIQDRIKEYLLANRRAKQ